VHLVGFHYKRSGFQTGFRFPGRRQYSASMLRDVEATAVVIRGGSVDRVSTPRGFFSFIRPQFQLRFQICWTALLTKSVCSQPYTEILNFTDLDWPSRPRKAH
jgi:hypothetical protein